MAVPESEVTAEVSDDDADVDETILEVSTMARGALDDDKWRELRRREDAAARKRLKREDAEAKALLMDESSDDESTRVVDDFDGVDDSEDATNGWRRLLDAADDAWPLPRLRSLAAFAGGIAPVEVRTARADDPSNPCGHSFPTSSSARFYARANSRLGGRTCCKHMSSNTRDGRRKKLVPAGGARTTRSARFFRAPTRSRAARACRETRRGTTCGGAGSAWRS